MTLDVIVQMVPALASLAEAGVVRMEGNELVGQAADGVWCALANFTDDPKHDKRAAKQLAAYLADHAGPASW
jgi:hypothetical protein